MTRSLASAFALSLLAVAVQATITPQCIEETRVLHNDSFLDHVQDDLYEEYKEDFDSVCDFTSITNPDCGLKFDGDNETYVAACLDKNGQIFKREIKLKCGYSVASFDYDLGLAPTCVGASCNLTAIGPEDLKDTRFDELLGNFSFVGCDAVSGATGYSLSPVFYTTIVVAGIVGMIGI